MPDCEFFVNKRDYPNLKFHPWEHPGPGPREGAGGEDGVPVEPYGFLFDRDDKDPAQDVLLSRHRYRSYAPIL